MKIAWISSWPPRPCGIATYSSELVEALRDEGLIFLTGIEYQGRRMAKRYIIR